MGATRGQNNEELSPGVTAEGGYENSNASGPTASEKTRPDQLAHTAT